MKRIVLAALALASFAVATSTPSEVEAAGLELNVGSLAPKGTPWMDMLLEMEKRVETGTSGAINVIIRPPGVMSEVEMARETRSGERLQGCGITTAAIAEGGNIPQLQLVELPYLFNDDAEADHVMDTLLFGEFSGILARRGYQLVAWSENGWRSFATKGKPVRQPDDLKSLKMRSQESDVHMAMYTAYGGNAVQKPMTEVLTALQSGQIDGLDNTALYIQAGGLAEPLDYFSVTRHIYQPAAVIISKRFYDGLSAEQKKVVDGLKDIAPVSRTAVRAEEKAMIENFPLFGVEVVTLTAAEREAFASKARGTHAPFVATVEGGSDLYAKIQASLKAKRGK